ncbi:MAG TPA: PepSY domain-containing protein [Burkholderiales bacterium]|nr:PepSY domain-containing protein [Burkholderiales bacterium]
MKNVVTSTLYAALLIGSTLIALPAQATGLATCDSGPPEKWQPQAKLEKQLTDKQWQVRRIKVDGGCYEVYGINEKGERVGAYFHPVTLEPVPTKAR